MSSSEEPPSSERMRTMEDEGVEQLQPTILHSKEAATTGEGVSKMWYAMHAHAAIS